MENDKTLLENLIKEVENILPANPKYELYSEQWYVNAPDVAGCYFVWEGEHLVYIGETGNLRKRMRDLKNTLNHTLRRKIGSAMFSYHPEYKPASSKRKFTETIEQGITNYCKTHLTVSYIPLTIGRKEVEETFLNRNPKPKYNSPSYRRGV
ncbi:hypothetical protein V7103_21175 [Neobacillus drentensis]|uniref:GIY-YIG nuclease family protein n=1 Tax=Neobacillus drentensis TaxID=220684 RepID=UPI002FFF312E